MNLKSRKPTKRHPDAPKKSLGVNSGKGRAGYATILSFKLIKRFCLKVEQGLPADAVCDYYGISATAYHNWLDKGNKYLASGEQPEEDRIYGKFVLRYRRAFAKWRERVVLSAQRPGNNLWVRDVTLLERRDRKNFSRQDPAGGSDDQYSADDKFL